MNQQSQIKLSKPEFIKIQALKRGLSGYNVYVKITSVELPTVEEGKLPIAKAVVADETGAANAFFKGENIKLIKQGSVIAIRNGCIKYIKNHISLEVDMFGRITPENVQIKENLTTNISSEEIAKKPRRRPQDRDGRQPFRENRGGNDRGDRRDRGQRGGYRNDRAQRPRRNDLENRNDNNDRNQRPRRNDIQDRNDKNQGQRKNYREDRRQNYGEKRGQERGDRKRQQRGDRDDRQPHRNFDRPPLKWTKIGAIQPADDELNIIAKVVICEQVKNRVRVVLGDETGIIKGYLFRNEALKVGASVAIFRCEARVVKEHIELQLMQKGRVQEARKKIENVDDTNNISSKEWVEAE